jgi:serine/threonine-protein kinase HipA
LLEHVGEDCAGAVQFVKPERVDQLLKRSRKPSVSWISDKDLSERMELLVQDAAATRLGGDTGQFSLAGAQPKLALFREEDSGRWGIPEGRTPTTHILKPSTGSFDGQTENEHFCLQLARHLGFVAANSWVMVSGNIPVIVIERYDRVRTGVQVHRIHQEDMCQALGVPPHRKYQNQGGPSAKQIAELLYTQSSDPAEDVGRFADSLILNWLIGGTDGHAKNFSLLLGVNQQVRLAPLYDVASSLPYPQQIQPRKATLALKIGREYRLQRIDRRDWETCARELRLPAKDLLHRIQLLAETLPNAAKETAHQLQSSGITHPVIPKLVDTLGEHCQNCIDALSVF